MREPSETRILAGDIGGTHARLAVFRRRAGEVELLRRETYRSAEHRSLQGILERFVEGGRRRQRFDAVCLGLAAPIHDGPIRPPNLPWQVGREEVRAAVGSDRVTLINDVQAAAAGIPGLAADRLDTLQPGRADPAGNRAVISVGTGLGVGALLPSGETLATEAGHASFSPTGDEDLELLARLRREHGHVSWERIASGAALPHLHAWLAGEDGPRLEPAEIVGRCGSDPVCRQAVETLRRQLGAFAGNVALTLLATGGVFLAGGVAPQVLDPANAGGFLGAFADKGRMRPLLERIPVFVVHDGDLALKGAARTALARVAAPPTAQSDPDTP